MLLAFASTNLSMSSVNQGLSQYARFAASPVDSQKYFEDRLSSTKYVEGVVNVPGLEEPSIGYFVQCLVPRMKYVTILYDMGCTNKIRQEQIEAALGYAVVEQPSAPIIIDEGTRKKRKCDDHGVNSYSKPLPSAHIPKPMSDSEHDRLGTRITRAVKESSRLVVSHSPAEGQYLARQGLYEGLRHSTNNPQE